MTTVQKAENFSNHFLIIGFGKLGSSLGRFLRKNTDGVIRVVDRLPFQNAYQKVVEKHHYFTSLCPEALAKTRWIFICVGDGDIARVVEELQPFNLNNKFVVHTSGTMDTDVLAPLKKKGAYIGSLHPLQTFPVPLLPAEHWEAIYCTFAGDAVLLQEVRTLVASANIRLIEVDNDQKRAVHLAAVVAANFQVALFSWADTLIKGAGLHDLEAGALLAPLVEQVAQNFARKPLSEILSGPLQRGDVETIRKHLAYLEEQNDTLSIELYRLLSKKLLQNMNFPIRNRNLLNAFFDDLET